MSTPPVMALKQATASIPIVMLNVGNPLATGLIQSLAHPGGNITGTSNAVEEWRAKRLQMVKEVLPGIRCLLFLRNPANPSIMAPGGTLGEVRRKLGIEFQPFGDDLGDRLPVGIAFGAIQGDQITGGEEERVLWAVTSA